MGSFIKTSAWVLMCSGLFSSALSLAQTFPYATRTLGYSGLGTTIEGDVRSIGMAGATLGLADHLSATRQNPAGLAMTTEGFGLVVFGNTIADQNIQSMANPNSHLSLGVGGNFHPWGFALGSSPMFHEGQTYNGVLIDLITTEWRLSVARLLFDNHLALGTSLLIGDALQQFGTNAQHSYAVGATFSALVQLPQRWLVGLTFTPRMNYSGGSSTATIAGIANPFQGVSSPERAGLGVGWIPNRFFRAGFSVNVLGTTPGIALLRDQTAWVGQTVTLQPRLGVAYSLIDFRDFSLRALVGAYWEASRIVDLPSRLHFTGGLEVRPWVLEFGWAVDFSPGYQNMLFLGGLDVVRLMQKLEFLPSDPQPPYGGTLPRMSVPSELGLPRAINSSWRPGALEKQGILELGKQIPQNIEKKIGKTGDQIQKGFEKAVENFENRVRDRREQQRKASEREDRWRKKTKRTTH